MTFVNFFIKAISVLFVLISSAAFFCAVIFVSLLFYFLSDIPDHNLLYKDSLGLSSRVYASNGEFVTEFFHEHRIFIPIEMIPEKLIQAFLATEDKSFYSNPGIDFAGILRAMLKNIFLFRENKLVGGSTITQQVVKNYILGNEKSMKRKIQEAILALKISNSLSKNQIMELYLNKIYLGNGAYGVVSGALKYFGKNVDKLSLAEFALLAAMPQAPSKLDPFKNYYKAKERRDWVLSRMHEEDFITSEQAVRAQMLPIYLSKEYSDHIMTNDYFLEELRRILNKEYGEKLYKDGLYVRSTLNVKYQSIAKIALSKGLIAYDRKIGWRGPIAFIDNVNSWKTKLLEVESPAGLGEWEIAVVLEIIDKTAKIGLKNAKIAEISDITWAKNIKIGDVIVVKDESKKSYERKHFSVQQIPKVNGGILVMEVETGKVLAMVGGYDFSKNQFNNVTQAMRQPGSLFKPFVYLTALENHFTPSTIINDEKISLFQGVNMDLWEPKNYENNFLGPVTLRFGLEKSRNIVTVHIANILGLDKIAEQARKFDIYHEETSNLSVVLGSEVTNLLSITKAYAMLANGGKYIKSHLYEKIQDRNGKNIFLLDNRTCKNCNDPESIPEIVSNDIQIVEEAYVSQIVSILEGAVQHGTARKLKSFDISLGAKTGTTSNSNDAWFIGFTPKIVVGIYVGYDQPETLGNKVTGATVALPIFSDFLQNVLDDVGNIPFKTSKDISFVFINPKTTEVGSGTFLELYKKGTEPTIFDNNLINDLAIFDESLR